jgi:hypothetical protein
MLRMGVSVGCGNRSDVGIVSSTLQDVLSKVNETLDFYSDFYFFMCGHQYLGLLLACMLNR